MSVFFADTIRRLCRFTCVARRLHTIFKLNPMFSKDMVEASVKNCEDDIRCVGIARKSYLISLRPCILKS
jgi:hypothetical protein